MVTYFWIIFMIENSNRDENAQQLKICHSRCQINVTRHRKLIFSLNTTLRANALFGMQILVESNFSNFFLRL